MRRLGRVIRRGLVAMSLLLCVLSVVLWVRGHWRVDSVLRIREGRSQTDPHRQISWSSSPTGLAYGTMDWYFGGLGTPDALADPSAWEFKDGFTSKWKTYSGTEPRTGQDPESVWNHLGFYRTINKPLYISSVEMSVRSSAYILPHWFATLATALLPLARAARFFRTRRARRGAASGLCPTCGYDCRATPDRCPECGAVAPVLAVAHRNRDDPRMDTNQHE